MKTEAVRIHETGGADKMRREEITLSSPAADEALVRHEAIGVNFIDVYHRTGLYPQPLPAVLGLEAAGVVEAAGEKSGVSVGERVGYCVAGLGAYAKHRLVKGERLIRLPDDIGFEQAAALLLKGMTVEYLIRRAYPVRAKDTGFMARRRRRSGVNRLSVVEAIGCAYYRHRRQRRKSDIGKSARLRRSYFIRP